MIMPAARIACSLGSAATSPAAQAAVAGAFLSVCRAILLPARH